MTYNKTVKYKIRALRGSNRRPNPTLGNPEHQGKRNEEVVRETNMKDASYTEKYVIIRKRKAEK